MFKYVLPEDVGISSERVLNYLKTLDEHGLYMHSVIMAKGNNIFTEAYWKPFNADTLHRMYSTTKSYVGIAVSQLAAEGKISLDDKIIDYFPESQPETVHEYFKMQTIRNMLMMQTCVDNTFWFKENVQDRIKHYFALKPCRFPQTGFSYDSEGSFVLGALVEKVTGKTFLDYLREKCLNEIGYSKEARCLKAPGGYSWGDSALLAKPMDMFLFGRLVALKGNWNGKQLLDKTAVATACQKLVDNHSEGNKVYNKMGYGYQIWRCYGNSFAFYGMHDQLMIYDIDTDITFVCTAGNPEGASRAIIIDGFFENIVNPHRIEKENTAQAQSKLTEYIKNLELYAERDESFSDYENEIDGVTFKAEENPMGIAWFKLCFEKESIRFCYENEQGKKKIVFGRNKNTFCQFPQTGYSNDVGSEICEGHTYFCAASASWRERQKLSFTVQIIDDYIGILNIVMSFVGNNVSVTMRKMAENFLDEYSGDLNATAI